MTSKSELKRTATLDPVAAAERIHALERENAALATATENMALNWHRVQDENAALRHVVEKAAEWDPENTDNADLAALGAYARAALQPHAGWSGRDTGHMLAARECVHGKLLTEPCSECHAKDSGNG